MLKIRILSALILFPITLLAIFWLPPMVFASVLLMLMAIAAWEWSGMIGAKHMVSRWVYTGIVCLGLLLETQLPINVLLGMGVFIWLWVLIGVISYQSGHSGFGFQWPAVRAIAGFAILLSCWVAIITLNYAPDFGPIWLVFVLLVIWGADIGGYFCGRFLGKRHLASRVSPNKTWAGFVGGLCVALIIAVIASLFFDFDLRQNIVLFGLTLLTALFSVVGDLGVSLVKRISGVKDTGHLIPGHGGLFDRLDSVAAATVIFTFVALLLGF